MHSQHCISKIFFLLLAALIDFQVLSDTGWALGFFSTFFERYGIQGKICCTTFWTICAVELCHHTSNGRSVLREDFASFLEYNRVNNVELKRHSYFPELRCIVRNKRPSLLKSVWLLFSMVYRCTLNAYRLFITSHHFMFTHSMQ